MAPLRWISAAALLAVSFGCDAPQSRAVLVVEPTQKDVGGHLPPELALTLRTSSGARSISKSAYFAALGPEDSVAYVNAAGLHLWRNGRDERIAAAAPRGLAANAHGVLFTSAAESGQGSGLSLMSWSGKLSTLIAAPETLPGQAGYHKPAISPEGRYALVFSDLTARPSLYRVALDNADTVMLVADAPSAAGELSWAGERLSWSTGDERVFLDVQTGEVSR